MRSNNYKSVLKHAALAASVLLLASGAAFAQQQINLTAGPATATLPDGTAVPMWGYSCDAAQVAGSTATCTALNKAVAAAALTTTPLAGVWSPVVITVPTGQDLRINLTNSLTFAGGNIPTSLVIVGQLGGGLGTTATSAASPDHTNAQPLTWPIAADAPGTPVTGVGTPPVQGTRVQSFSTEVAAGTQASLCWGPTCTTPSPALKPGTYLIESGTHPSIQGPMGLYGILVVTCAPGSTACTAPGTAYPAVGTIPAVTYNADIPLLLSEIDPVQNAAVQAAVGTVGFNETNVWSGLYGGCGNPVLANGTPNPTYQTCYPPAVNYTPLYYLINGQAFDKTNASASLFPALAGTAGTPPAPVTTGIAGTVLVRLVNAGLRMHVPSIVGAQTGTAVAPALLAPAGLALIAEDGNVLPGVPRVQSEVFMPAGKTTDVMINVPTAATALPIFDRELSLSANSIARDAGMLAYIGVNGAALPTSGAFSTASTTAVANPDSYYLVAGNTLVVSDVGKGVVANDVNVNGVQVLVAPTAGTLALNPNGTFSYVPNSGTTSDSFTYCANGTVTAAVPPATTPTCSSNISTTVTLAACAAGTCLEANTGIVMGNITYTANGTFLKIQPPGILAVDKDNAGYPLTVNNPAGVTGVGTTTLSVDPNGGFSASVASCVPVAPATTCPTTFTYKAQNSQGTVSSGSATVTVNFAPASGLSVTVLDGKDVLAARTNPAITPTVITDYRWIIEEDRTFYVNPNCTTNPPAAGCPGASTAGIGTTGIVPTFGTNFHTSYMPLIAAGCTGQLSCEGGQSIFDPTSGTHINAVCDVGNGVCRPDISGNGFAQHLPGEAHLDPTKRYYLTIFPGDAGNPFANANLSADCTNGSASASAPGACGHGMGGIPIAASVTCSTTGTTTTCALVSNPTTTCTATAPATCNPGVTPASLTVLTQPDPYPPSKLSVFVFEDDFPLNGEQDGGGGIDVLSPNEPGLGGFNITLFDDAGGTGDATGQMTYDMFNQPLVNALAGTIDPATSLDACPVSRISRIGANDPTQTGITGTIVTCPKFESDGRTLSPLAGQAVIANLMPGRYGVVATPGADRIGRGEEWLQTNTLDGQKAHDSFLRIGEPSFFQEFGPAGYHVAIGFANPAIINARLPAVCNGSDPYVTGTGCTNTLTGFVSTERMSRTPDERLYGSGDNSSFAFTQCYVSVGDADGEDFAFTKCDASGHFTLSGLPNGDWRLTVFDQWNDMLVDGLSTPVRLNGGTTDIGEIAMNQWQANIYTSTFFDANGNGVRDANETGLTLVPTNIRFRDGSYSNFNNTDLSGNAGFNEVFPLFSWYVIETDSTRYKNTGIHVVYDAGGPADGTPGCGGTAPGAPPPCGPATSLVANMANSFETVSVPTALQVPGAVYCTTADCSGFSIATPGTSAAPSNCTISPTTGRTTCTGTPRSTGRIDPPWVLSEGWQGFSGQNSFLEFGKAPFAAGENGGIRGEVIYASTRPFDDPQLLLHTSWTPDVPGVTINLYQVGTAPDGTQSLTLVDTTKTSSWDDWAQGFRSDGNPNMNCPGQLAQPTTSAGGDLFFFTMFNQPMYLDVYNNGGTPAHTIPNNSQFKCYDGMHNWNQLQPAPYDGMYTFPSIAGRDPTTGRPVGGSNTNVAGTNCTVCVANPTDGTPMLPNGQYVVEMIVPPGYELVKEEDKNILIGDNYIAPVTQEFPGLGSAIYILPDQASVASVYNANQGALSGYNATNAQNPTQAFGRQSALASHEGDTGSVESFWPCVGTTRIVPDFISLFPQSHEVAPFAGAKRNLCDRKLVQLDDQTSALAKFWVFTSAHVAAHFTGVITDDFTSEFDPFSPQFGEKFSPANLPVAIKDWTGQEISRVYADQWGTYDGLTYSTWEVNPPNPTGYAPTMMVTCMNDPGTGATPDPLFNPAYSQFCYEIPFMPGQTQYMDTPVTPTSAFAGAGYNNADCAYPDATPAVAEVDGDQIGPWVSAANHTLTIHALGDQMVPNHAYVGPAATTAPYNQKTIRRHYGFGNATGVNGTAGSVTIGGVPAPVTSWSDSQIVVSVPNGVPACGVQQQAIYGGSAAQCGELVINTSATAAGGNVTGVTITRGGSYNTAPTVTFGAAPAGGTTATGTANLGGGRVTSVAVTNGGTGFTSAPTVTFTGGGGSGATATATVRKRVTAVTITNLATNSYPGTGPITVTFSGAGAGGTTVTGTVTTNGGAGTAASPRRVTGVTITNPTTNNYAIGATIGVTFSAPATGGTRATGNTTAAGDTSGYVSAVTVAAAGTGTGYTSSPTVGFTGGGGSGATATAAVGDRVVTSVTLTNGGGSGYTTAPSVTFSAGLTGGTSTATGTATIVPRVIVAGRRSIDSVTVTIGGKPPVHVAPTASIQAAIDAARPGDLLMIDPTTQATATTAAVPAVHQELLLMWKPVRLQGVGAAGSVLNANTHPAGKLDAWRRQVNCLFGLAINGQPMTSGNPYDPSGVYSCANGTGNFSGASTTLSDFVAYNGTSHVNPQVDRLPLEAVVGWDASQSGNLAELLQEPSLMGALEGAGITVLAKGMLFSPGSDPFGTGPSAAEGGALPTDTILLDGSTDPNHGCGTAANPYASNFYCNPSSIDGLTIENSSQGGGGIFVHGWGHNLQITNNRITNNSGTLSGGINVGQGEYPPSYIQGSATNAAPGSCEESPVAGATLPYCHNVNVNIQNNYVALNSSTGDELFSATPAGAGGVSVCTGADYYKFNYNWVCGNLSSGDGGGFGHLGFSYNGDVEHNSILFNQSTNPTIPANGGGMIIMGTPDADIVCNGNTNIDTDCAPPSGVANIVAAGIGPSDGVGPGLVINANLIMGNAAESGTGGGIAFQAVNGSDMVAFPDDPGQWNSVTVTNNIIVDNVAGWDGAGISLVDSSNVNIINNTIALNASTASSGVLFNTLGGPIASQQGPTCTAGCGTTSHPQIAGVAAMQNSAVLMANLAATPVVCPAGHFVPGGANAATNGACRSISYPKLENNIIYQNRSYDIGVGALGAGPLNQQNVVTLYNAFTGTPVPNQTTTGACVAGSSYWDIGVRGDTGPTNHGSGFTLNPSASVLSSGGYTGGGSTSTGNPNFVSFYCNGSRTPPEFGASSWQVPPGISDATVPNPIFSLTPAATVDEGNNWVNIAWGPLSMSNPTAVGGANGNYGGGLPLGNYSITSGSAAAGRVTGANFTDAPEYDFFDNPRKPGGSTDAGAVRLAGTPGHSQFTLSPPVVDFGSVPVHSGTTVDQDIVVTNSDVVPLNGISVGFNCAGVPAGTCSLASFGIQPQSDSCSSATLGAGQSCMVTVVFIPNSTSQAARNANLVVTAGGLSQTVSLTGHDTIATIAVSPATQTTPTMRPTPASTVAITGTITVTNTSTLCVATPCPAGSSLDAGPYMPTAITLTPVSGTGTWAVGGTCAVGTAINPGVAAVPSTTPPSPAVPNGTCTVTATYTPPAGATGGALNGSARLTVSGYGTASTAPIINRVINAN
jgi:hypothetical protein